MPFSITLETEPGTFLLNSPIFGVFCRLLYRLPLTSVEDTFQLQGTQKTIYKTLPL
ncbi:hypothetical protein LEMLEM_LOCUS1406, partial [Lemmus lemmus]